MQEVRQHKSFSQWNNNQNANRPFSFFIKQIHQRYGIHIFMALEFNCHFFLHRIEKEGEVTLCLVNSSCNCVVSNRFNKISPSYTPKHCLQRISSTFKNSTFQLINKVLQHLQNFGRIIANIKCKRFVNTIFSADNQNANRLFHQADSSKVWHSH